ncbi:hypothetical protein MSG28_008721 [Choristoneura fumiferana]|uniref:Uncharacterized protein n=1 Tax=Choristoneura fumiferana TaxID=7141 RepID=A0ACC0J801_CHOFU|nr:hypothetical protein MSG28_008721 [Choristoneura fumiferana]
MDLRKVTPDSYMYENGTNDDGLLTRDKFMEVNARMDARRKFLRSECSRLGLDGSSHKAYAWEYLINRQYHVIWCNIFKAASTSWMYNFNLMANYTAAFLDKTKEVPLGLARKKYARPSAEMIKKAQVDSISFLIVRHPLERLASAYNDKIVHAWPKSFHDKMGYRIIRKYRKIPSQPIYVPLLGTGLLSEQDGLGYNSHAGPVRIGNFTRTIESLRRFLAVFSFTAKLVQSTTQPVPTARYPMFEEFVSYVLDEARAKRTLDMHWTPYTDFCTPCKFEFDVVLKFETLDEDQRYLIQLARLQDVVKPEWRNSGKGATLHNINHLYSRLKRSQLQGLYNLYKYDFQLFNYTIESYYEIVQEDEASHG